MYKYTSRFILSFLSFNIFFCHCFITEEICKKTPKYYAACRKTFIWDNDKNDFISVLEKVSTHYNESVDPTKLVLNAVIAEMVPYISSGSNNGKPAGFVYDIFEIVREKIGFQVKYISMDYYAGLKALDDGRADVFLGSSIATNSYSNIKFLQPYLTNWYKIYFRRSKRQPSSLFYLGTLNNSVWLLSIVIVTVLSLTLWMTSKIVGKLQKSRRNISIASCLIRVLCGFLNQDFEIKMVTISFRIQILTALLFGYILNLAVNAKLVAQITVSYDEYPIQSLEEIKDHSDLSLCIRSNSYVYWNFTEMVANERVVLPEWDGIVNGPKCPDLLHHQNLKVVCENNMLVLENAVIFNYWIYYGNVSCEVSELTAKYFQRGNSIAVNKATERKLDQELDLIFCQMAECGVTTRLNRLWMHNNKPKSTQNTLLPVTIKHIQGIFGLYLSFITLSIVILLIEILVHSRNNQL